jgi:hypothetical protein
VHQRANTVPVRAVGTTAAGQFQWTAGDLVTVLHTQFKCAGWRVVELASPVDVGEATPVLIGGRTGRSFEAQIEWGADGGSSQKAWVTVTRNTRVCVYANSVRVAARTLDAQVFAGGATNEQRLAAVVADSQHPIPTHNVWVARGPADPAVQPVTVPPFARSVRLDVADPAAAASSWIDLYCGQNVLRARIPATEQPPDGIPIGDVNRIEVTSPTALWRLTYFLHL